MKTASAKAAPEAPAPAQPTLEQRLAALEALVESIPAVKDMRRDAATREAHLRTHARQQEENARKVAARAAHAEKLAPRYVHLSTAPLGPQERSTELGWFADGNVVRMGGGVSPHPTTMVIEKKIYERWLDGGDGRLATYVASGEIIMRPATPDDVIRHLRLALA